MRWLSLAIRPSGNTIFAGRLIPSKDGEDMSVRADSLTWSELVVRARQAEAAAARSKDADIKAEWLLIARCYREMADQQIKPAQAQPK